MAERTFPNLNNGKGDETMSTQTITQLFAGQPGLLGGLSNEEELAGACPSEFRKYNPWSEYAMQLFYRGADISDWKWKSENESERKWQSLCFNALLATFGVSHRDKEVVAGWMLSEMLTEVPVHCYPRSKH